MPSVGDVRVDENGRRSVFVKGEWRSEDDYGGGGGFLDRALAGISHWTQTDTGRKLVGNPVSKWAANHYGLWSKLVNAGVGYGFGKVIAGNRRTGGGSSGGSFVEGGGPRLANTDFLSKGGDSRGGGMESIADLFTNKDDDEGGFDWREGLMKLATNYASNKLLGGRTSEERALSKFATAPYESSETQRFLPPALRGPFTDPMLFSGMANIGDLVSRPGGLSPNVAEAINPRLAAESQNIAQQFRGMQSNQAGAAARGNLPVSIKTALQSALDIAQERAQRGARGAALTESEDLRRRDVEQTYKILDAILQFISSSRGQAIPGLQTAAAQSGTRQAATQAQVASLLQSLTQQGQG